MKYAEKRLILYALIVQIIIVILVLNSFMKKKINQNHIKDKINIFQLLNIICETHQKKLEYFCIEENSKKI